MSWFLETESQETIEGVADKGRHLWSDTNPANPDLIFKSTDVFL